DPASNSFKWQMYTKVSDRLAAVLNRMLLPAPNQRFASAEQVITAIDAPAPQPAPIAPKGKGKKAPPPVVQPAPVSPAPVPPTASRPVPTRPAFSLLEIIGSAAFTGFETGLLAIALASVLGTSLFPGFWLILAVILAGMIFAQNRRWIEKIDLVIIAAVSLSAVAFVPLLNRVLAIPALGVLMATTGGVLGSILLITLFSALLAIAMALIFRLIYQILLRLL
ncbi:MAG TPA: serine/threonine protein kinase, partial [Allocoleopsis sp.]